MSKIEDLKVKRILHSIGLKNNLTDEQVREIFESQFRFAYQEIRKLNISDMTREEIAETKTNFYFKYIGKLFIQDDVLEKAERRKEFVNKLSYFEIGICKDYYKKDEIESLTKFPGVYEAK